MPKRNGTGFKSRRTGWRVSFTCGCLSEVIKYKRDLPKTCPTHGKQRMQVIDYFPRIETAVERDIDNALNNLGFDVTKFSQPGPTMQTAGIPDRYARHLRFKLRLWIEIKADDGLCSIEQRAWHQSEIMAGGDVIIVRTVTELLHELQSRGIPLTIQSGVQHGHTSNSRRT